MELKEALNAAIRGEQVLIERHGQVFELRVHSAPQQPAGEDQDEPDPPEDPIYEPDPDA
jgi:hypothetical protein